MPTYVNDLRLTELNTGEGSGTWGTTTNTNLELIGESLGFGTQAAFASDANATTTIADGSTDPARAMYFKVTSGVTLSATRELTIAPNTITRVMYIENATTGTQSITIKQGSGGTVTIAKGNSAIVYLDGAGSGAAVVDANTSLAATKIDATTLAIGGTAVTSTAAELNILDGVTSTTAELNILDGVTSTTAELNILDGVTSTATELNLLDGSTADTVVNSKAVVYGAAGQVTANELDVDNIQLDANAVKSTNTNGNIQLFPNGTGYTELYGNTNAGAVRFNCESNSHGVTLKGPPHSAGATYTLELPDATGSARQIVNTNGSGKLSFTNSLPDPLLKSANYTAVAGDFVVATAGSITITLPASPSAGNAVTIKDGTGAAATTSFTVARNSSNIASSASDLTFDKNFAKITLTYINATIGWSV